MQDNVVVGSAEGGGLAFRFAIPAQEAQIDAADARMRFAIADEAAGIGDGKGAASGGKIQDTLARGKNIRGGKMLAAVHQIGAAFDPLRNGKRTGTKGGGHCLGNIGRCAQICTWAQVFARPVHSLRPACGQGAAYWRQ
jgi:hypothetical protein